MPPDTSVCCGSPFYTVFGLLPVSVTDAAENSPSDITAPTEAAILPDFSGTDPGSCFRYNQYISHLYHKESSDTDNSPARPDGLRSSVSAPAFQAKYRRSPADLPQNRSVPDTASP